MEGLLKNKLMLHTICLLAVCLTGDAAETTLKPNETASHTQAKLEGFRNESVFVGTHVTLHCTNSNIAWKDFIYVIWKISLPGKECTISTATEDKDYDTCTDNKKLIREQDGSYSLIIPNVTIQDKGKYICDVSIKSVSHMETIYVSVWEQPYVKGWLEVKHGQTVAVCVVKSKINTTIYWKKSDGNNLTGSQKSEPEDPYTVRSELRLLQNQSYKNLSCVVRTGPQDEITFKISNFTKENIGWPFILLGVCSVCFVVTVVTLLYIMRERFKQLSVFQNICCKPNIPKTNEEKTTQPPDFEEVQPYASYVQRENSIYNSSAELFNA